MNFDKITGTSTSTYYSSTHRSNVSSRMVITYVLYFFAHLFFLICRRGCYLSGINITKIICQEKNKFQTPSSTRGPHIE